MKKILCPIDFGLASENALKYASELAMLSGGEVNMLHALHIPSTAFPDQMPLMADEDWIKEMDEAKERLEALAFRIKNDFEFYKVKYSYHVMVGFANDEIKDFVKKANIDIIVMGTEGAHGIADNLFGTHTLRIVNHVECPVLIVPENVSYSHIRKIMYATDVRGEDDAIVDYTVKLANIFQAEINFLHIAGENTDEVLEDINYGARIISERYPTTDIKFHEITDSDIKKGIQDFVMTHEIDLLVISPRRKTLFQKILTPSVTKDLIQHPLIPTLAFQKQSLTENVH